MSCSFLTHVVCVVQPERPARCPDSCAEPQWSLPTLLFFCDEAQLSSLVIEVRSRGDLSRSGAVKSKRRDDQENAVACTVMRENVSDWKKLVILFAEHNTPTAGYVRERSEEATSATDVIHDPSPEC